MLCDHEVLPEMFPISQQFRVQCLRQSDVGQNVVSWSARHGES